MNGIKRGWERQTTGINWWQLFAAAQQMQTKSSSIDDVETEPTVTEQRYISYQVQYRRVN